MFNSITYRQSSESIKKAFFNRLRVNRLTATKDEIRSADNDLCSVLSSQTSLLLRGQDDTINKPTITFDIVNADGKEHFFGMRAFPSIGTMEEITKDLVVHRSSYESLRSKWSSCKEWYIEIDAQLFDPQCINSRPDELLALLLSVIGNTMFDFTPLTRFIDVVQDWFYPNFNSLNRDPGTSGDDSKALTVAMREQLKTRYLLFMIPLWVSCKYPDLLKEEIAYSDDKQSSKWSVYPPAVLRGASTNDDTICDVYLQFIAKMIRSFGTGFDKGENYAIYQVGSYVRWAIQFGTDENHRKHHLHDNLLMLAKNTSGQYGKALVIKILNDFGVGLRERFTGAILESAQFDALVTEFPDDLYEQYSPVDLRALGKPCKVGAMEALVRSNKYTSKSKQKLLPSDYEIDTIGVEIDRINSHHDRIYVLDLIYRAIDEIEEVIRHYEMLDNGKTARVKAKGESQLKRLYQYRDMVMAKKNFNHDYKVFVKVPPGYEG